MKEINISRLLGGKMTGIPAISTASLDNDFCKKMSKIDGSVCQKCYGIRTEKIYPNSYKSYSQNSRVLMSVNYRPSAIYDDVVRFNAFGELYNGLHFKNLCKLAEYNPETIFVLWTKRYKLVQANIEHKPDNLLLVYSSPCLDKPMNKPPKHFNKVFNVFTKEYIKDNNIDINCGAKSCKKCMMCYSRNNITVINEKVK